MVGHELHSDGHAVRVVSAGAVEMGGSRQVGGDGEEVRLVGLDGGHPGDVVELGGHEGHGGGEHGVVLLEHLLVGVDDDQPDLQGLGVVPVPESLHPGVGSEQDPPLGLVSEVLGPEGGEVVVEPEGEVSLLLSVPHADVPGEVGGRFGGGEDVVGGHGVLELGHVHVFHVDAHALEVLEGLVERFEDVLGDAFHGLPGDGHGFHLPVGDLELGLDAGGGVLLVLPGDDGQVLGHLLGIHGKDSDLVEGVPVVDESVPGDASVAGDDTVGTAEAGGTADGSSGGHSEGDVVVEDGCGAGRSSGRTAAGPGEVEGVPGDAEPGVGGEGTESELVHVGLPDEFPSGSLQLGDGCGIEDGAIAAEDAGSGAGLVLLGGEVVLGGEQELGIPEFPVAAEVVEHLVLLVQLGKFGKGVRVAHTSLGPLM